MTATGVPRCGSPPLGALTLANEAAVAASEPRGRRRDTSCLPSRCCDGVVAWDLRSSILKPVGSDTRVGKVAPELRMLKWAETDGAVVLMRGAVGPDRLARPRCRISIRAV